LGSQEHVFTFTKAGDFQREDKLQVGRVGTDGKDLKLLESWKMERERRGEVWEV
jgi:hypothetical protein